MLNGGGRRAPNNGLTRRERRRKDEARARRQSARPMPGGRRLVSVLVDPGSDGMVRVTIYRAGKLMVRQALGLSDQFRCTMAWDTKTDIRIGRLFLGPNHDGSMLVGVVRADGNVLTSTTLPAAAADDVLTQIAIAAGTALGLRPRGERRARQGTSGRCGDFLGGHAWVYLRARGS